MDLDFGDYWWRAEAYDASFAKTTVVLLLEKVARAASAEWHNLPTKELRTAILRRFYEVSGDAPKFRDVESPLTAWAESVGFDLRSIFEQQYDEIPKIQMEIRNYLGSDELARFYYAYKHGRAYKPNPAPRQRRIR